MKGMRDKLRVTKKELVDLFGGKCQRCGYDRCMRALQFHHADDSEKAEWSKKTGKASPKVNRAHPERFLLLCANCHFEEHDRIDRENRLHAKCLACGETFITEAHRQKSGRGNYCSKTCHGKDRHNLAIAGISDRLWKHVEKVGECWVWTGYATNGTPVMNYPLGYKKFTIRPAARILWELERGPLDKVQRVWRACKTPLCIRPDHQIIRTRRGRPSRATRARMIDIRMGGKSGETQGQLPI